MNALDNAIANRDLSLLVSSHQEKRCDDKSKQAEAILARLFDLLSATYGDLFTKKYSWEDRDAWGYALQGVSPDQIKFGIEQLRDEHPKYPPKPNEFYSLCIGRHLKERSGTWEHQRIIAADREYQALPAPTRTNEQQRESLGKLRAEVGL